LLIKGLKESEKGKKRPKIAPHIQEVKEVKSEKTIYAEEALEYVCWLVNANNLYNVALDLYDFDLVTMVATQTHKDPKEFLPYLNSLKEMDPVSMKFRIQVDLGNFDKAIREVSRDETHSHFDEILQIVKKNRLYRVAIREFAHHPEFLNRIKSEFGQYLYERKYFEESGLMFQQAGKFEGAIKAFKETSNY
jgi:elongator complex protein 1